MKRLLVGLIVLAMLWIGCGCAETEKTIPMTVIADCLNGRSAPRKTAFVEARFGFEDPVEAIRWRFTEVKPEPFGSGMSMLRSDTGII